MRKLIVYITLILGFYSCGPETIEPPKTQLSASDVLIGNEGNFGWGEATLSLYNPDSKTIQNEVFKGANQTAMGNVLQSISRIKNAYYFVVNNSSKIVVTNDSFQVLGSIGNLTSPRYIYSVSDTKAYVTDLYQNGIHIVDLNSRQKTGEIALNGWSEQAVVIGSEFYVCNVESNYVYVIDIVSDNLVDSISVNYAPQDMLMDKNGLIWVLSRGHGTNQKGSLTAIDPSTKSVLEINLIDSGIPTRLNYDSASNNLFYILGDVNSHKATLGSSSEIVIANSGQSFYALGISKKGELYVSDAHDYTQASTIYRYNATGQLLDEFKAGIISTDFYFK